MSDIAYQRIRNHPRYAELVTKRRRLALSLAAIVLGVFFVFILVVAFDPKTLATPVFGGVVTLAMPLGIGMIVGFWLLTGLYVRLARRDFDAIRSTILREAAQ